jgi:hypothetical protein
MHGPLASCPGFCMFRNGKRRISNPSAWPGVKCQIPKLPRVETSKGFRNNVQLGQQLSIDLISAAILSRVSVHDLVAIIILAG